MSDPVAILIGVLVGFILKPVIDLGIKKLIDLLT